ncbi:MAG: alpha/beta hydrolase [Candidatus Melainabacteria bacterium]|nr:alpha/beta hydrolase [Candidatus Melainabacteria bacterium]
MGFFKPFARKKEKKVLTREQKLKFYGFEFLKLTMLALFLSPANSYLTNFMLFHPEKDTVADAEQVKALKQKYKLTWTDEYFHSKDGTKLHAWHITKPGAQKTFLVSHGNGGNLAYRLPIVEALADSGGSIFIYEYQGYGGSDGEPTPEGIVKDGLGAYDFLVNDKKVAAQDVVLYGESLGCAVATAIAKERPVSGVILQSGFSTIAEAARDKLPWFKLFPDQAFPQRFLDNVTAYKTKHPPLLLIHGLNDWILPCKYSQEIFDSAVEPKQIVLLPNCSHNDVYGGTKLIATKAIGTFVKNLISQTVANKKATDVILSTAAITDHNLHATKPQ